MTLARFVAETCHSLLVPVTVAPAPGMSQMSGDLPYDVGELPSYLRYVAPATDVAAQTVVAQVAHSRPFCWYMGPAFYPHVGPSNPRNLPRVDLCQNKIEKF